jgi:chemotaxis protein methyltransferase CheR
MAFTFFFRDKLVLDMIVEHALPVLKTRNYIHIWDAGCAMGPEPFTLSIMLRENMGKFLFRNVRIHATDIDENDFGKIIQGGTYPEDQIKSVPPDIREKYFTPIAETGELKLSDEIRGAVTFQRHDLLSLVPIRTSLGLIMCKNVLLHFNEEQRVQVLKMFYSVLDDNGFLAMEQTQKMPSELSGMFEPVVFNAQLFRKKSAAAVKTA